VLLGGCCGTTPAHIAAMVREIAKNKTQRSFPRKSAGATRVSSGRLSVEIGGKTGPVIIGERINPTGKKKCKEALLAGNMQFVLDEAASQIERGAHILDVNVGLPGIDEEATMARVVSLLQKTFSVPLQIDSSEPSVIERALRYYNGKALVNSVNGKQETMNAIFPLIKKYGGAVVALTLDENGIPPTAAGRFAIAERIIKEAAKYGIPSADILIDTLTLTVSSQQDEALETLKAVQHIKEKYGAQGVKTVLGVSNISFGLPRREIVNSRFFAMALYAGLDTCIINPLSADMLQTYHTYRVLAGFDKNCGAYIEHYADTTGTPNSTPTPTHLSAPSPEPTDNVDLKQIIIKGYKDRAGAATKDLLKKFAPLDIINTHIVPALDVVGVEFESGRFFLPQLLLSADTVSCAFEEIKAAFAMSGETRESAGTIVLATVYGDIHDIGKNIVKALLENYGYTVIDLGKNVSSEMIIETVITHHVKLVGLSALMTTTVANMEKTIAALRKALVGQGESCVVMAGGAVLTAEYAKKIGADYYAKDALAAITIAKEVFV
jgi:5-methyltetrahydrofolate--homocysteine methyltransferase